MALDDRDAIMDHIAQGNPLAAIELDDDFQAKAEQIRQRPKMYRIGRVPGTREAVVRANYVMVYALEESVVAVLRVLHAAQKWP